MGRTRGRADSRVNNATLHGIIAILEVGISELQQSMTDERERGWRGSRRRVVARLLDSTEEFKLTFLQYAKTIADEGFRGKAEELTKELFGPVYWRVGCCVVLVRLHKEKKREPMVAGMSKRDLLRSVWYLCRVKNTLAKLSMDWQDSLRQSAGNSAELSLSDQAIVPKANAAVQIAQIVEPGVISLISARRLGNGGIILEFDTTASARIMQNRKKDFRAAFGGTSILKDGADLDCSRMQPLML
ncbi:hypothetical protein BU17DRAFT_62763 [Hysterangium stoloniferum]|nr:hypothetical protein BU17DRAFT_62763 [Hysterangium stoloniferum]